MGFDDALLPSIDQDDTRKTGIGPGPASSGVISGPTWGAYGAKYARRANCLYRYVVKITKGASTWLFGDSDMRLTDGHVYPLLLGDIAVEHQVDYLTKKWSVHDVKISVRSVGYKQHPTTHTRIKFEDEAGALRQATCEVWILAGPQPTALVDGFNLFAGEISEPPTVSGNVVELTITDGAQRFNRMLPLRNVAENANWTGIPWLARLRKLPIVYGEYTKAYDDSVDLGLIRCEAISQDKDRKFVCSDHALHSIQEAFVEHEELQVPSRVVSPALTANDSGYGTAVMGGLADARLYVDNADVGDTVGTPDPTVDAANAGDLHPTTKAHTYAAMSGLGGVTMYLGWRDFANNEKNILAPIGRIIGENISGTYYCYLKFKVTWFPILTGATNPVVHLKVANYVGSDVTLDISSFTNSAETSAKFAVSEIDKVLWHLRSGDSTYPTDDRPLLFEIFYNGTVPVGQVGVDALWCYYCYLQYRYKPYVVKAGWVAGKGRVFGSWIDAAGRSNTYSAGDLIDDPAYIIESILRDCLGFGDADIDMASFDSAADSSVKARIQFNSDDEKDAFSAIRELAEQSRFAVVIDGASRVRLVPLNVVNPTIKRVLRSGDIDIDQLEYSQDPRIVNKANVRHRWQQEHNNFKESYSWYDQTEFSDFFPVDFKWKNITDSFGSAAAVAQFIVGKWGHSRTKIKIFCPGIANVDLSVGDWIQLDATTVDPRRKCFGESWSGKNFLVARTRQSRSGRTIEAIQLA